METIIALYLIGSLLAIGILKGSQIVDYDKEIHFGIYFVLFLLSWFGVGMVIGSVMQEFSMYLNDNPIKQIIKEKQ